MLYVTKSNKAEQKNCKKNVTQKSSIRHCDIAITACCAAVLPKPLLLMLPSARYWLIIAFTIFLFAVAVDCTIAVAFALAHALLSLLLCHHNCSLLSHNVAASTATAAVGGHCPGHCHWLIVHFTLLRPSLQPADAARHLLPLFLLPPVI